MSRILKAREGFVYTNGAAYGHKIKLGIYSSEDSWYEISEEEYREILRKQEEERE